ncbi:MAG: PorV/PorQ family protein, partial [Elusimicrobia bacterium]|nr:PorV/PorQ family protein [Elusimicrobiota bacterium]
SGVSKGIFFLLFFLTPLPSPLTPSLLWAGTLPTADFLNLQWDARPLGMGEAGSALDNGGSTLYLNPASLRGLGKQELFFTHAMLVQGIAMDYAGYAVNLGKRKFAVSYAALTYGSIEQTDLAGNTVGQFSPRDELLGLTYGSRLARKLDFGVTAKYVQSKITQKAETWTMDAGLMRPINGKTNASVSVTNLGGSLKYIAKEENLPAKMIIGAAHRPHESFLIAADLYYPLTDLAPYLGLGSEYIVVVKENMKLGIRGGLNSKTPDLGGLAGINLGFGLKMNSVAVNYAYDPFGDFGDAHLFSMTYGFGQ